MKRTGIIILRGLALIVLTLVFLLTLPSIKVEPYYGGPEGGDVLAAEQTEQTADETKETAVTNEEADETGGDSEKADETAGASQQAEDTGGATDETAGASEHKFEHYEPLPIEPIKREANNVLLGGGLVVAALVASGAILMDMRKRK